MMGNVVYIQNDTRKWYSLPSLVLPDRRLSARKKAALILSLAVPAMLEQVLQTLVGFADMLFVARLGTNAVAAVGVANAMILVAMAVFLALGVSASSFITRSIGAGRREEAAAYARQAVLLSVGIGAAFGVAALLFAEPILRVMGAEPRVLADAVTYFRIVAVPAVFMALMVTLGSILRASGDTRTPMKVSLWINLIHLALDYVLIFGVGSFAGWGIAGAAWATTAVRVIGAFALFAAVQKSPLSFSVGRESGLGFGRRAGEIMRRAMPVIAERMIMRFGVLLYYGAILSIGTDAYAAHVIAANLESVMILAGAGFEVAATVLVGQYLGAGRPRDAYAFGMVSMWLGMGLMSLFGIALYAAAPEVAALFAADARIAGMVVIALTFMALYQPPLAMLLILRGGLQGAGDTRAPMYATAVGMWVVRLTGVYAFGIHMGLGLAGVWLSIFLDVLIRGLFLLYLFRRRFRQIYREQGMETTEGIG
jgi:putative MATE family efflux protein